MVTNIIYVNDELYSSVSNKIIMSTTQADNTLGIFIIHILTIHYADIYENLDGVIIMSFILLFATP